MYQEDLKPQIDNLEQQIIRSAIGTDTSSKFCQVITTSVMNAVGESMPKCALKHCGGKYGKDRTK
jgi:hypothetical protein